MDSVPFFVRMFFEHGQGVGVRGGEHESLVGFERGEGLLDEDVWMFDVLVEYDCATVVEENFDPGWLNQQTLGGGRESIDSLEVLVDQAMNGFFVEYGLGDHFSSTDPVQTEHQAGQGQLQHLLCGFYAGEVAQHRCDYVHVSESLEHQRLMVSYGAQESIVQRCDRCGSALCHGLDGDLQNSLEHQQTQLVVYGLHRPFVRAWEEQEAVG